MLNKLKKLNILNIFFYALTFINLYVLFFNNSIAGFLLYYLPIEFIQLINIFLFFYLRKTIKTNIKNYFQFDAVFNGIIFLFFISFILFIFLSFTYKLPTILILVLGWLHDFKLNKNKFLSFSLSSIFFCSSLFYLHPEHGNNILNFKILFSTSLILMFYHFSKLNFFKYFNFNKLPKNSLNYFNFFTATLILWWFIKEIFNIGIQFEFNFIYNLAILFLIINALFLNKTECKQKIRAIINNNFSFEKDWLVIFPVLFFLIPMMLIVNWDLPNHYHPGDDEYVIPSAYMAEGDFAKALNNPNTSQNPLFDNQHSMYYVLTPFFYFFKPIGYFLYGNQEKLFANYFLLARLLNYIFSILIIFLTYLSGKILFNRQTALLAAIILATGKIFMHFSLFMRSDMILTFLISLIFLYFVLQQKYRYKNFILSGAIIGLGLSLKPYMLLFGVLVFLFQIAKCLFKKDINLFLANSAVFSSAILIFFHFGRFYNHFIHQDLGAGFYNAIAHATTGHYGLFPSVNTNTFFFGFELLYWWMGFMFVAIFILAIIFSALQFKKKEFRYLLIFIIPIYLYFSSNIVQGGKFYLILLPPISTLIAVMFTRLFQYKNVFSKLLIIIIFFTFFLQYLFISLGKIAIINQGDDIRILTEKWVNKNIKPYSNIALLGSEKSHYPQIDKNKYNINKDINQESQYLILPKSSFHKLEYYLNNPESYIQSDWLPAAPPAENEINLAKSIISKQNLNINGLSFKKIKTIKKEQTFLGLPYDEYFSHPASWELWSVNNPKEIIIYEKVLN